MFFIVFQLEPPKESLSFFWIIFAQTLFFSSLPTAQKGIIKHFTLRNSLRVSTSQLSRVVIYAQDPRITFVEWFVPVILGS